MKILLINPPCDSRTIGLRHIAKIEPLGLELIGAAVKGQHEVRLVDLEVAPGDLDEALEQFAPDIAGVTSEIVHRDTAIEALRRVRRRYPQCLTIAGGHHPTMAPEDFNDSAVDLVVIGEGVETFREICAERARGGSDYSKIAGLGVRRPDGSMQRTTPRPQPTNLDDFPLPDRTLTARYRKRYFYIFEPNVAAVRTSYGCTSHCTFCSVRVYSEGGFIARSAEQVFEEIRALDEDFIMFCDDHSFLDPERMRRLAELLLAAGVKKRYFAYGRADSIVANKDVFALWVKAGLTVVMTGLEAMDDRALKRSGKQGSIDINEQAVRISQELGFWLSAGFLVEPDFGREDFERIDRYARERPSILITEYTALTPFPGTPLHRKERSQLLTHDHALYDLQHFVLPTRLPSKELYDLLAEFNARSVKRATRMIFKKLPQVFLSPHAPRMLLGLVANGRAFKQAHRYIVDRRADPSKARAKSAGSEPARDAFGMSYQGWSGCIASAPAGSSAPPLVFDPAPGSALEVQGAALLLTHGHPEHINGALAHLRLEARAPVTVVASSHLCSYLEARSARRDDRFIPVTAGATVDVNGWTVRVFEWEHMPLLPPEPTAAARHVFKLVSNPRGLAQIALDGARGPRHGPMLGFAARAPGSSAWLVYYGEGIHRLTTRAQLKAALGDEPIETLVFGVEPEDAEALPDLLAGHAVKTMLAFEPHRPWRAKFKMAQLDLDGLASTLQARGVDIRPLHHRD
ncbi:MAG: cobalamin-dependent protein [Myxococcales bacterium]|nr:cobalamin-dependent protein [Myxococcales bacterium]